MGSDSKQVSEIPKVDLTGLKPSVAGGERWEAARAALTAALHSHGCFEAVYPSLSTELREEMFGRAVLELFSLPLDSKLQTTSGEVHGYVGQIPHFAYESLPIYKVDSPAAVQDFTHLMWPEGNSTFCNTVVAFGNPLHELVQIVLKLILESLGVEKYFDSLMSSITFVLWLAEYGVPLNKETKVGLDPHVDPNLLTIICQHKVGGLEVQTTDGNWVNVDPSPYSVTVVVGLAFQAWSNMRVRAPTHRVKMFGKEKRFSAIYAIKPSRNSIVKCPEELGDDVHPLLYKPFDYTEFINFLYSEEGLGKKDAFDFYCRLSN